MTIPQTLEQFLHLKEATSFPTVVCLCGSTRFFQAFQAANLRETLKGNIVLSIGCDTKSDHHLALGATDKVALDLLHLYKIDLADEILVLNVGGYIGESTQREVAYARLAGKRVRYLEPTDNEEERARIDALIEMRTWPDGWTGDEVRGDELLPQVLADGVLQPLLLGSLELEKEGHV